MLNPADHLLKVEYKKLRNELTSALRNSELNHYSDDLELHQRDFHKTWNVLKVILGKDGNNSKRKIKFLVNGDYITDSIEMANSFNIFFVSIGPELARNIVSTIDLMSYVNNCNNSLVIPPIIIAEVRQTILSFNNSSPGWDDFPAIVAKQSIDSYIEPLTCLINRSFADVIFPNE